MILNKKNNTVFYVGRKNKSNDAFCDKIILLYSTFSIKPDGCILEFSNGKRYFLNDRDFSLTTLEGDNRFIKYQGDYKDWLFKNDYEAYLRMMEVFALADWGF